MSVRILADIELFNNMLNMAPNGLTYTSTFCLTILLWLRCCCPSCKDDRYIYWVLILNLALLGTLMRHRLMQSVLKVALWVGHRYYLPYTDGEAEAQRDELTPPKVTQLRRIWTLVDLTLVPTSSGTALSSSSPRLGADSRAQPLLKAHSWLMSSLGQLEARCLLLRSWNVSSASR